jgi:hypothetical protein
MLQYEQSTRYFHFFLVKPRNPSLDARHNQHYVIVKWSGISDCDLVSAPKSVSFCKLYIEDFNL